jgi:Auxiliary Activity family 9 (formerly GH61)
MQTNVEAAKYTFNLPACIPDGEYLLRIQSLAIHNPGSTPQWYVSCAQIATTGGGTKDLGPKVAIPGAFKATDPGYTVNIYNNVSGLFLDKN